MMNEPTNRATTANTRRKVLKKAMSSFSASCSSLTSSVPVSTSMPLGTAASIASASSRGSTPSSASTLMASTLPGSVSTACAVVGLNMVT